MAPSLLRTAVAAGTNANGQIVFSSFRDGRAGDLWSMSPDGRDLRKLTGDPQPAVTVNDAQPTSGNGGGEVTHAASDARIGAGSDADIFANVLSNVVEALANVSFAVLGGVASAASWANALLPTAEVPAR